MLLLSYSWGHSCFVSNVNHYDCMGFDCLVYKPQKICSAKQSSKGNTSAENKCNQNEDGRATSSALLNSQKVHGWFSGNCSQHYLDQQAIMSNKELSLHLTTILADLKKEMWLIQIISLLWIAIKNYNLQICTHD